MITIRDCSLEDTSIRVFLCFVHGVALQSPDDLPGKAIQVPRRFSVCVSNSIVGPDISFAHVFRRCSYALSFDLCALEALARTVAGGLIVHRPIQKPTKTNMVL